MSVFAVGMMKDEADVAYHVVKHLMEEGVDGFVVADNLSTDGTFNLLQEAAREFDGDFEILEDEEVGYYQSDKMTRLARHAAQMGAEWIVPFDADEIWYGAHSIKHILDSQPDSVSIVNAALHNHFCTSLDDPDDNNPFTRMQWRHRDVGALPKVAFRYNSNIRVLQGNHSVEGTNGQIVGGLEIRHFPYRSWDHFLRKAINGAKAYGATNLDRDMGAHWRGYGEILERHGEDALRGVYDQYFYFMSPVDGGMIYDPAPFRRW